MPLDEPLEHINRAVQLDPKSPACLQVRAGLHAWLGNLAW
jgi:hypothetical protein